jgi:hypothetical protein
MLFASVPTRSIAASARSPGTRGVPDHADERVPVLKNVGAYR